MIIEQIIALKLYMYSYSYSTGYFHDKTKTPRQVFE